MNQKRKYRHFILFCLVLDLLAVVFLGYRYLDRKIPDEIHIDRNSGLDFSSLSGIPFVSFGIPLRCREKEAISCPARFWGKYILRISK